MLYEVITNPVDLTGSVTDDMFVMAADLMFQEPSICGIILLGLHHMPGLREVYIDGLVKVAESYTKPIVMCDIGETEMALYTRSRFDNRITSYNVCYTKLLRPKTMAVTMPRPALIRLTVRI